MDSSTSSTPPKTRHFDSLEQEAFLNLWRTYDRLHLAEEALFSQFDLTPQQYNVLRLLRPREGRPGEPEKIPTLTLASRLVSRAPDITRMIDKLESRGLVERHRPPENRRVVLVSITAAGQELLGQLDEPVRECHFKQLGHMPEAKLRGLIELLQTARSPHEDATSSWR